MALGCERAGSCEALCLVARDVFDKIGKFWGNEVIVERSSTPLTFDNTPQTSSVSFSLRLFFQDFLPFSSRISSFWVSCLVHPDEHDASEELLRSYFHHHFAFWNRVDCRSRKKEREIEGAVLQLLWNKTQVRECFLSSQEAGNLSKSCRFRFDFIISRNGQVSCLRSFVSVETRNEAAQQRGTL